MLSHLVLCESLKQHVLTACDLSCSTLWDPIDRSPPGSFVHGILPARILEWTDMPSSRGPSQPRDQTCVSYVSCIGMRSKSFRSCPTLCDPWTVAHQAPLSMGFSRPFPIPEDYPETGIKPISPALAGRILYHGNVNRRRGS